MWRHAFVNFCFLLLAMIFLSIQHSTAGFGLAVPRWPLSNTAAPSRAEFGTNREAPIALHAPARFSRAAEWLEQTWQRVKIFDEWLIEYNTSQWEILRASSPVETDLLQARYHVANAEVFTEAMREKSRAIKELNRAADSLQAAEPLVNRRLAPQLASIRRELAAAESTGLASVSTPPLETIKVDLDRLLMTLRVS
jgi:hypothetical protein